jgi:hypothetical protein
MGCSQSAEIKGGEMPAADSRKQCTAKTKNVNKKNADAAGVHQGTLTVQANGDYQQ